jgi:hypothetical protein
MNDPLETLRFPVGHPELRTELAPAEREEMIRVLEELPARMREALDGLTDEQLDTPYRPEGWTLRQVAHHVPDSHVNSYVRFKLAVTEENPTIQVYDEKAWAEQTEAREGPVEMSLVLLEGLHRRWVAWLRSLPEEAWSRPLTHPEVGPLNLSQLLCIYDWHSRHHLAHITTTRDREGW